MTPRANCSKSSPDSIIRRKGFSSMDKAWAVQALGYDPVTGNWGPATDDPSSNRPWSNTSVAKKLGSSKTTISGWRKNATFICDSVANAPGRKRARGATYPEIEDALTRFYFASRRQAGRQLYHTNLALKEKALQLQQSFLEKIGSQVADLGGAAQNDVAHRLRDDVRRLAAFKASNGWLAKWKKRAGVPSPKRGRPASVQFAADKAMEKNR